MLSDAESSARLRPWIGGSPIQQAARILRTCACAHLIDRLTLRYRCRPDRPSGLLGAHRRGGAAFIDPVVPLEQVVRHLSRGVEAGQATGLARPFERAGEHEGELTPGQMSAERLALLLARR